MSKPRRRIDPKSAMGPVARDLAPLALVDVDEFLLASGWKPAGAGWWSEPHRSTEWTTKSAVEMQLSNLVVRELEPLGWRVTSGFLANDIANTMWYSLVRELRDPVTGKRTRRWTTAYQLHVERVERASREAP